MASNPRGVVEAGTRFAGHLADAAWGMGARVVGAQPSPALKPAPKDRRFSDPAWEGNAWFFGQRQAYLAWSHLMHELPATSKSSLPNRIDPRGQDRYRTIEALPALLEGWTERAIGSST